MDSSAGLPFATYKGDANVAGSSTNTPNNGVEASTSQRSNAPVSGGFMGLRSVCSSSTAMPDTGGEQAMMTIRQKDFNGVAALANGSPKYLYHRLVSNRQPSAVGGKTLTAQGVEHTRYQVNAQVEICNQVLELCDQKQMALSEVASQSCEAQAVISANTVQAGSVAGKRPAPSEHQDVPESKKALEDSQHALKLENDKLMRTCQSQSQELNTLKGESDKTKAELETLKNEMTRLKGEKEVWEKQKADVKKVIDGVLPAFLRYPYAMIVKLQANKQPLDLEPGELNLRGVQQCRDALDELRKYGKALWGLCNQKEAELNARKDQFLPVVSEDSFVLPGTSTDQLNTPGHSQHQESGTFSLTDADLGDLISGVDLDFEDILSGQPVSDDDM